MRRCTTASELVAPSRSVSQSRAPALPDSSWDSRRALHRSPPNEFDCHAPSSRGSYRQCITMYPTLACPRHTCRHHPRTHTARCLRRLGPELSSCCLAAALVFEVDPCFFERCETGHWVVTCTKSVSMALHGNVELYQLFGAKSHSLLWENACCST